MIGIGIRESLRSQVQELMTIYDYFSDVVSHLKVGNGIEDDELLIDSDNVDQTKLYTFVDSNPKLKIMYIIEEVSQNFASYALAHQIQLIDPSQVMAHLTLQDKMANLLPIVAFWGVFPRLGTTTISLLVGKAIAEQHHKRVGMIGLNGYDPGQWMFAGKGHSLDDVLPYLQRKLDRETLLTSMESVQGLKYLPGLRNPMQAWKINPDYVRNLIETANTAFDVTILDLGSVLNTALALEGLSLSSYRYVVANDLLQTQRRFFDYFDYVLRPLGISQNELLLVGNQLHGSGKLDAFAKTLGLYPMTGIPMIPFLDQHAETRSEPLKLFYEEKSIKKAIDLIAQDVVTRVATPADASTVAFNRRTEPAKGGAFSVNQ